MTQLDSLTIRQTAYIDTHERAILYATLKLIESNKNPLNNNLPNPNIYLKAVRLTTTESYNTTTNTVDANVIISAKFPYYRSDVMLTGGNVIEHIIAYSSYIPSSFGIICNPTPSCDGIGNDESYIDSLEKYFAYHALKYAKALRDLLDNTLLNKVNWKILDEDSTEPSIQFNVILPYDYDRYLLTKNLLCSLKWCGKVIVSLNITNTFTIISNVTLSQQVTVLENKEFVLNSDTNFSGSIDHFESYRENAIISNLTLTGSVILSPIIHYALNEMLLQFTGNVTVVETVLYNLNNTAIFTGNITDIETIRYNTLISNFVLTGTLDDTTIIGEIYNDLDLSSYQILVPDGIEGYSDLTASIYQPEI